MVKSEYHKKWRERNPDYMKNWREKNQDKIKEYYRLRCEDDNYLKIRVTRRRKYYAEHRNDPHFILSRTLTNMKSRCYNSNSWYYHYYGERGIIVCDEWLNNSDSFIKWSLLNGWEKGLTIDRINNNGNYTPNNCRFATRKQQAQNRRRAKLRETFK